MTTYLLVVFLLTPALRPEYDAVTIAQYSSYEACDAAGKESTGYTLAKYTCISVIQDGKIPK